MVKTSKIKSIKAKEILDSRGKLTIEVELFTNLGKFLASVPSGTSKGKYEAVELPAKKAIKNVNQIIGPKLKGKDPTKQKEIDQFLIKLDGRKNKSKLGANAILGVSMAVCRAGAEAKNLPLWKWISKIARTKPKLPIPCILFLESGLHGKGRLDIQEIMGFIKRSSFKEEFRIGKEIFRRLGKILRKKYGKAAINLEMEGAFLPPTKNIKEALDLLMEASKGKKIKIILDVAASHSHFKKTSEYYLNLVKQYPILGIEDPFPEDDWQNWKKLNSKLLVIGDDLTVTNLNRIKLAFKRKACSGIIIKPNQVGTITETIEAAKLAKSYKWQVFVKHRSGETKDDFIADLAVGLGTGWIMAGAPTQRERLAKYNRLLKIEEEIK